MGCGKYTSCVSTTTNKQAKPVLGIGSRRDVLTDDLHLNV